MSSFEAVARASEAREHDPERGGLEIHMAFGAAFGRREAVWKVTKSNILSMRKLPCRRGTEALLPLVAGRWTEARCGKRVT